MLEQICSDVHVCRHNHTAREMMDWVIHCAVLTVTHTQTQITFTAIMTWTKDALSLHWERSIESIVFLPLSRSLIMLRCCSMLIVTQTKSDNFFFIGAVLTHRTAFVHASSVAIWGRRCIKAYYVWTFSTIQFKSNCNAISTADRRGICRPADFAVDNNCVAECWCWSVAVGWSHGAPMPSTILIHQLRDCNERFRAHCLLSMWDCWSVEQSELAARWEMRWRDKRVRWRANSLRRSVRRRTAI